MEVCKNKQSGKFFILLEIGWGGKAKFVTPESKIKTLNTELFDEPEEWDDAKLSAALLREEITIQQKDKWKDYEKQREQDQIEKLRDYFNEMTEYEKQLFLEELNKSIAKDYETD